jgi:hypothetical protein
MAEEAREKLPYIQKLFDEGREVTPDVVANLVLTLASGIADSLSGRLFSVDDNVEQIVRRAEEVHAHALYLLRVREA